MQVKYERIFCLPQWGKVDFAKQKTDEVLYLKLTLYTLKILGLRQRWQSELGLPQWGKVDFAKQKTDEVSAKK